MTEKALVIDDDADILEAVADILKSMGHECDRADSVESAREYLDHNQYSYVLLDLEIPVCAGSLPRIQNGENLLEEIIRRSGTHRTPIIVMTAHGTDGPDLAVDMMKKGAVDYVTKPFKTVGRTLDKSIRDALDRQDDRSSPPSQPWHGGQLSAPAPKPFEGGTMAFHPDRVELCGVDICSGARSARRRRALDLLRRKRNGRFIAYSGKVLAERLEISAGQNGAARVVCDLRTGIKEALQKQANVECGDEDVILSRGPGYRLSDKLSVQDGDDADGAGIQGHGMGHMVQNDPVHGTVNDPDRDPVPETDGTGTARRTWILHEMRNGRELRAPHIAEELHCSLTTAKRDLDALRAEGKIKFDGAPRTGHYRLCEESEDAGSDRRPSKP